MTSYQAPTVAQGFVHAYAAPPDGVWSAPGRVNLMGEHTDYNSGLCLPIALPHRTFVAVAVRDDGRVRIRSEQEPGGWDGQLTDIRAGHPEGWASYAAGVLWALAGEGFDVPGLDIWVDGHVPLGAGLSSSAALEAAVAVAVDEVAGLGLGGSDQGRARLAAACVRAENDVAGAPTGGMDQAAALRSEQGNALLIDCQDFSVAQEPLDLAATDLALLVIDTRAPHRLVDSEYGARRETCEAAVRALGVRSLREVAVADLDDALAQLPDDVMRRRVRHIVTEIERVRECVGLLQRNDVAGLGPVFDTSHASMRDDYEISCHELDLACESARAAGALGARMTGGGFGGSAVSLVPRLERDRIGEAVLAAFAADGLTAPGLIPAFAAGPAHRDL